MGAPSISVAFIEKAQETIHRGARGVIAMILKDSAQQTFTVAMPTDIPAGLSTMNKQLLQNALLGYEVAPRKIIVYVIGPVASGEELSYNDALTYLGGQKWDYLVVPTMETDAMVATVVSWVGAQRTQYNATYKVLVPNTASDAEYVINVANKYKVGDTVYTEEQACARVAGIICGTSTRMSCTYAPLPEATDCDRMTSAELDEAVDAGKLVFFWDGEKVKICRGVTSFVTPTATKGDSFKKIRLVEFMDMIKDDIRITAQDRFVGRYPNTYDSKCVLIAAINQYFAELQSEDVISTGSCEIDLAKNIAYINEHGGTILIDGDEIPVADATEQQIKEAPTGSIVYLRAAIRLVDAIEDIVLDIYIG